MKKLLTLIAALIIALCGCAKSPSVVEVPNTLTEIPDNALFIQSYAQSINNGMNVTDADFTIDEESTGYIILDVKYSSGSAKDMKLVMVSPEKKTLIEITTGGESAIYTTEINSFPSDSWFQLSFGSVLNYEATYDIYFVSTVDDQI